MPESDLVPTAQVTAALAKPTATVADVLKAARPEAPKAELAQTPIPSDPALAEEAWDNATHLPTDLAGLRLPDRRRMLSEAELEAIIRVYETLDSVAKGLGVSREQIKSALFNHFDAVALDEGRITTETPRTKEGWAVVEDKHSAAVPGMTHKLTREVRAGKTELTVEGLRELVDAEEITHEDYLALTRATRVVVEAQVLEWIRKNPGKAQVLLKAVSTGSPVASFHLRKND